MSLAILAIFLFISIFLLVLYGYPVAFTLCGLSLLYAVCFLDLAVLTLLPNRVMGVMENSVLLAVPLFVFMGIMLEKSGLAERMLHTMSELFGRVRGGMAVSVIVVGALLAASTGIVGATVITMGLISLPPMLKRGYPPSLATGVIAASGTLGQIIPPSVVLVLLGSVLGVSVGKLFSAALVPSLLLVGAYVLYILALGVLRPKLFPSGHREGSPWNAAFLRNLVQSLVLPLLLIVAVLGSIIIGFASPTEAAAIGAAGAMLLTWSQQKLTWPTVKDVCRETTHLTAMVFMILLGATTFSLVFRELGGDRFLVQLIERSDLTEYQFLFLVMVVVFIAGFFIDFIEIIFIIVPVVTPLFVAYETDLIWLGILLGINLQTSFLSPPFGFALFYLKGVAPPEVKTVHLYRGIVPFLLIQLALLALVIFFPEWLW
ncbi:TRAP transporter large permease subunit [Neolewinella lacunae]|uniref:TRAP transporter large permease subunit n=1 Tax=Neolewinella lacunae TaxID=1517758 RepID=A0A923T941_9BACT|nr:TRAP transporter large permease subunit [Neolewinella lacunae]MBC6994648.1 TRAP transporter large permease subunit [Neolewinella lacunae]MDN3634520.1 TRAP transporter large permease subunit [Neolewinella lacunae]